MCYFTCRAQKNTISCGFNLISNSWQNTRWQQRWRSLLVTSQASGNATTHKIYSQTSLMETPKRQNQLPALQSCPYHRGRECMIFGISETKRTVRNREVSVRKGYTVPHLVEKIKGFLLKAKSFRNTATNQKL